MGKRKKRRTGAAKPRRQKTSRRQNTKKTRRPRSSLASATANDFARLARERDEALEQQAATAEVLKIINSSPGQLETVFQTILANAVRICEAKFGVLYPYSNGTFHPAAEFGVPPALSEFIRQRGTFQARPQSTLDQLTRSKQVIYCDDIAEDFTNPTAKFGGARTYVAVPMLKESKLVGTIIIYRQEVRPFTDKQIKLLENFAAQAVIAIENTRLLNELRQRTDDLTDSLEQQTATSEVLRVISSSPGELEPVFETVLENAVRLCEAKFGFVCRYEGDAFRVMSQVGAAPAYMEYVREPFRTAPETILGQMLSAKRTIQIPDLAATPGYAKRIPLMVAAVELGGVRTYLATPMFKENEIIGAILLYRQEVKPFTDRQIELVKNFAAQAVIAIENARLLNDLNKLNQQLEQRVTDQVSEIERMGRLRRFLPPQVADLIVASGTEKQLESHRQEITALFCDLRGFTGFSESSDPEDVMALLAEYHAAIGKIIIKYSGTLERYAGDGVMVIFNDPVPVENPALQAVLMALDMRAAIGSLIEKWRDLGHDLGFGIGIAHGFATLGTIGFEGRRDYAAIGTVSNVASRLCDEAKPGQILISPRVRQAVEKGVTVEAVGEFALKGIRRPMTAYNVLEASLSKRS
jgi:adenylate cyclase